MSRMLLLLLLGGLLVGCGGGGGTTTGIIEGTVTDSTNQAAIVGATVSSVGTALQATTNAQGNYTIAGVPAGSATVSVAATGYVTQSRDATVVAGQTATLDFSLTPEGGGVIEVHPGESIQAAVDAAQPGQTVLIYPGTYRPANPPSNPEAFVVFRAAKNGVTLRGAGASPSEVILDGNSQVLHVIFLDEGIDRTTVIENLTVTGGYAWPDAVLPGGYTPVLRPELDLSDDFYHDGSGLMVFVCAPTIRNCRIINNSAERCGGGVSVFCPGSTSFPIPGADVFGNEIVNNSVSSGTGGGVDVYFHARADIINNLFIGNSGWGGAAAVLAYSAATVDFNTIVGNHGSCPGLATDADSTTALTNTIFANNQDGPPVVPNGTLTYSHLAFWNNAEAPFGEGHILADPLFVNAGAGDYHLSQTAAGEAATSPCVDAGSRAASGSAVEELTTRTDGTPDTGTVDIGYHYRP